MSLKTLRLQPSFQIERQKLQREAEILADLRHEHIVHFHDVVEGPDHLSPAGERLSTAVRISSTFPPS